MKAPVALGYDRRMDMSTHALRADGVVEGFTAGDVARSLRRERSRQGLSVKDVSTRTGIPVAQLRAAETGALNLPDQLSTLKTVRRYADFLGLPGDRYALALLEHWPTKAGLPTSSPVAPTAAVQGLGDAVPDGGTAHTGPPTAALGTPHPGAGLSHSDATLTALVPPVQ